jgi:hypothetical protein
VPPTASFQMSRKGIVGKAHATLIPVQVAALQAQLAQAPAIMEEQPVVAPQQQQQQQQQPPPSSLLSSLPRRNTKMSP